MKQNIKTMWIEALRGDEYEQARGSFIEVVTESDGHVTKKHCCLAVLTDLAVKNGCPDIRLRDDVNAEGKVIDVSVLFRSNDESYDPEEAVERDDDGSLWFEAQDGDLPLVVAQWAGITVNGNNPVLNGVRAISRNDEHEDSFSDIADAIEQDAVL